MQFGELRGQLLCERFSRLPIGRHVDAPRFHHDGVDKAVDVLEMDSAPRGAVECCVVDLGVFERGESQQHPEDGQQPEEDDDGIKPRL